MFEDTSNPVYKLMTNKLQLVLINVLNFLTLKFYKVVYRRFKVWSDL